MKTDTAIVCYYTGGEDRLPAQLVGLFQLLCKNAHLLTELGAIISKSGWLTLSQLALSVNPYGITLLPWADVQVLLKNLLDEFTLKGSTSVLLVSQIVLPGRSTAAGSMIMRLARSASDDGEGIFIYL